MGQAAEDLENLEWRQSMPKSEVNPHGYETEPIWKMRDGTKIKLSQMETSHIRNCIRMLERGIVDPYQYGEPDDDTAAYDAFMQGVAQVEERNRALLHNIRLFNKELRRRGEEAYGR